MKKEEVAKLKAIIKAEIAELKPTTNIENSQFYGVHYDAKAVETISLIAEGLIENAKGLSKLAEVLKASNVTIDAMLKVTN